MIADQRKSGPQIPRGGTPRDRSRRSRDAKNLARSIPEGSRRESLPEREAHGPAGGMDPSGPEKQRTYSGTSRKSRTVCESEQGVWGAMVCRSKGVSHRRLWRSVSKSSRINGPLAKSVRERSYTIVRFAQDCARVARVPFWARWSGRVVKERRRLEPPLRAAREGLNLLIAQ
jgi:hypothetical protein